jgi:DNA invertase Pin-like site-specific DNA recombinase
MSEDKIIDGLRRAAKRRERADGERHAASAELRKRVQDARAAGLSPTRIAQEAGLSRQSVYELLGHRQPS